MNRWCVLLGDFLIYLLVLWVLVVMLKVPKYCTRLTVDLWSLVRDQASPTSNLILLFFPEKRNFNESESTKSQIIPVFFTFSNLTDMTILQIATCRQHRQQSISDDKRCNSWSYQSIKLMLIHLTSKESHNCLTYKRGNTQ